MKSDQSLTRIDQLNQIPDLPQIRGRRPPLWMISILSGLGLLCGDSGDQPLGDFCAQHQLSLRAWLGLPDSQAMPSDSPFRRSFQSVAPQGWIDGFNLWILATFPNREAGRLSIAGKSLRCTRTGWQPERSELCDVGVGIRAEQWGDSTGNEAKQAFEWGFEQGFRQGFECGRRENQIEVAQRMLAGNFPIDLIARITGLSIEEIQQTDASNVSSRSPLASFHRVQPHQ